MRIARVIGLLSASLLLAGCMDFTEEVWISPDGSGRVNFDFGIAEELVALQQQSKGQTKEGDSQDIVASFRMKKEKLERHPRVQKLAFNESSAGGMHHFLYTAEVKDLGAIADLAKIMLSQEPDPQGQTPTKADGSGVKSTGRIEKLPSGNVLFVQVWETAGDSQKQADPSKSGPAQDQAMQAMLAPMFRDKYMTLKLHGPAIVSANGKLSEDKTTVEWKVPILEFSSGKPVRHEFRAEVKLRKFQFWILPTWPLDVWIAIAIAFLAGIGLVTITLMPAGRRR